MKILQFPLTRIFIGFLFGILLFRIENISTTFVLFSLGFSIIGLLISSFFCQKRSAFKIIFGCFTLTTAIIVGISTALIHKESLNQLHYTHQILDYEKVHQLDLIAVEKL